MNYSKVYDQIINRAKDRKPVGYTEKHHIVPRSLGGSDDKSNLVRLTPREHLIAHMLLVQIHKGTRAYYSMVQALIFMCSPGAQTKGELKSSTHYEKLRVELGEAARLRNLERVKLGTNPFAGEKGSKLAKERSLKREAEGKGMNFYLPTEVRSRSKKEFWASMSPEERLEHGKYLHSTRSAENIQQTVDKSAKTRRENDEKILISRQQRMIRINLFSPEIIKESERKLNQLSSDGTVTEYTNLNDLGKLKTLLDKSLKTLSDQDFSNSLKLSLKVLRQSQSGLAKLTGSSQATVGAWVKGQRIQTDERKRQVLFLIRQAVSTL